MGPTPGVMCDGLWYVGSYLGAAVFALSGHHQDYERHAERIAEVFPGYGRADIVSSLEAGSAGIHNAAGYVLVVLNASWALTVDVLRHELGHVLVERAIRGQASDLWGKRTGELLAQRAADSGVLEDSASFSGIVCQLMKAHSAFWTPARVKHGYGPFSEPHSPTATSAGDKA